MDLSQAPVTLILLIINTVVSLVALTSRPELIDRFAFKPVRVLQEKEYYRLFTAGIVHVDGVHLLFNMVTLYFFGPWLEGVLGPVRFVILYIGSDLAAQALSLVMHQRNPNYAAVGASGAISGVLFGFCLYEPFRMLYLFFAIPIPALVFAIGFVALSVYAMRNRGPEQTGGLAHEAHLGGALGGLALTIFMDPGALGTFISQLGL